MEPSKRSWTGILLAFVIHLSFTVLIFYCVLSLIGEYSFPETRHRMNLEWPGTFEAGKRVIEHLKKHYEKSTHLLLIFHCVGFLFLQTWCIPGTFFFNLFGGAIFGIGLGWPLCLFLNTAGAFLCYCLSGLYGASLLQTKYLKPHVSKLSAFVKQQTLSGNMFFYLVSFRLVPMSPNWAMNVVFPHIGVPPLHFFFSLLLGLAPWNYIACSAGIILSNLVSRNEVMTFQNYLLVC